MTEHSPRPPADARSQVAPRCAICRRRIYLDTASNTWKHE